ncbi:MAG: DUF2721 domain-containing protein [Bacteroidales bacterium]|nr:DUF2721 domain-containing protein [Bacteroidales bacterium]
MQIDVKIVEIIQSMLAPGIMISACGLLVLGINNKYSVVINRVRLLESERRILRDTVGLTDIDKKRLASITSQLDKLSLRLQHIRNTVISYSIAIALFILSCLSIGMQFVVNATVFSSVSLILFLSGMISVFVGVVYAVQEAVEGYRVVKIELDN